MISRNIVLKTLIAAFLATLLSSTAAWAQVESPVADQADEENILEEVVVTAQHREQKIMEVPISMVAITGDAINQMDMRTPVDVFAQIPNVNVQLPTSGTGFPIYNIRGVTLIDFTDTNEASVAIYSDEVYLGSPAIQNGQLYDLERVEILRGPQGTLWGRNATGGLVHFISAKPTRELEAYLQGHYGTYNDMGVEGAISGPIGDSARARFAFYSSTRDGWQKNLSDYPGAAKDFGGIDRKINARFTIEFDLGENATLTANAHYGNFEGDVDQRAFFGKGDPVTGELCSIERILASECFDYSMYRDSRTDPGDDPEKVQSDLPESPIDNENYGGWVKLDWDLGFGVLTSITSYDKVDKYQVLDADNSDVPALQLDFSIDHEQFSQEFRLGGGSDNFDWVTGLYYYEDSRFFTVHFPQYPAAPGYGSFADQDVQTWAAYGQGTWALSDTVNFTAGVRYTDDARDMNEIAAVVGGVSGTRDGYQLYNVDRHLSANKTTWRLALDWMFAADQMLYTSVSTGFKSGAYNTLYPGGLDNVTKADPEDITVYELGVKGTLSQDLPMTYNVAAFYNDYENVQAQGTVIIDEVPQSVMSNVSDAKIWGMEAELMFLPSDNLTFSLGLGYLNAEYVAAPDQTFNGQLVDGNRPILTPKYSVNGSIRYQFGLGETDGFYASLDFSWIDKVYFGPDNLETETQGAYGLANVHLGWMSPYGTWMIDAFVKNVADEEYFTHAIDPGATLPTQVSYHWGMPRTMGVKVRYNF